MARLFLTRGTRILRRIRDYSSRIPLQSRSDAKKPRGEQISASLSVSVARSAAQQSRVRPSVSHSSCARAPATAGQNGARCKPAHANRALNSPRGAVRRRRADRRSVSQSQSSAVSRGVSRLKEGEKSQEQNGSRARAFP